MLFRRFQPIAPILALAIGVVGCHSAAFQRQQLSSDYPLDRAKAAVALAEAGDMDAVQKLVDLLEDDDRAVRIYAILALERLCGTTYGYVFYSSQPQRDAAVRRWRDAVRNGEVVVRARERVEREQEDRLLRVSAQESTEAVTQSGTSPHIDAHGGTGNGWPA